MSSSVSPQSPILNSALDAVGSTPLIRLDRIAAQLGLKCNLLGKLESMSPAGSVKDRVAKRMVEIAEEEGVLIPGQSVVVEPTSGNTGIGLAMACAIKGYPVVVVTSQKASVEKETAMRALGAQVVRVPIGLSSESRLTHTIVAKQLQQTIPHAVILDQYSNPNNPLCHELGTAQEMIDAVEEDAKISSRSTSGKIDIFFASAGTGGTLTGVARGLKKVHNPSAKVIGVDVKGSLLAVPPELNEPYRGTNYLIEGIGYDIVPAVLTREPGIINSWVKTGDEEAFEALRFLLRLEGLLVGGSSGAALAGALIWLRSEEGQATAQQEGKNVVVLLPGGTRNYIAKDWFRGLGQDNEPTPVARQTVAALRQYLQEPGVAEQDKTLLVNSQAV